MLTELKPCPFCRHVATIIGCNEHGYYVRCDSPITENCWATMGENYDVNAYPCHEYGSPDEAKAAWNRRGKNRRDGGSDGGS